MSLSSPDTGQGQQSVAMTPSQAQRTAYSASSSIMTFLHVEQDRKPYQCGLCCVMFSVNVELVTHVRMHSLTKPYQCGYCKASYDSNPELKVHVQKHTLYRVQSSAKSGFGSVSPSQSGFKSVSPSQSGLPSAESLLTTGCGVLTELESGKDPNKAANCCTTTSSCPAVSPVYTYVEPEMTVLNRNVATSDNSVSYRDEDNSPKTDIADNTMQAEGKFQLKLETTSDDETETPDTFGELNVKTEDIASCLVPNHVGLRQSSSLEIEASCMESGTFPVDKTNADRPFRCDICGANFKLARYVKDHKKNIHEGKIFSDARPFQCTICKAGFKRQCDLSTHVMFAHERRQHVKERKKKVQLTSGSGSKLETPLGESEKVVTSTDKINPDRPFRCDVCGADFKTTRYVSEHKKRIHEKKIFSDDRPFQCTICKAGFKRNSDLGTHVRFAHERLRQATVPKAEQNEKTHPFQCYICEDRFTLLTSLQAHQKAIHKVVLPKSAYSKSEPHASFQCGICGSRFKTARSLSFHEKFMHESAMSEVATTAGMESRHQCLKCATCFKSANSLNGHFCQPKECPVCKRKLKTKNAYRSHMNIHTSERTYTCEFCGKVFLRRMFLVYHQNSFHFKSKPYKCDICQKGFNSHPALRMHKVRHEGVKNYSCNHCGKKFLFISGMKKHALRHSDLRLFACTSCSKTYKSRTNLVLHMKVKHEYQPVRSAGGRPPLLDS